MTSALSVPPLGGVGGRSTRYQITDKSPQQLGVIEAGSVLVNESTITPIYVGDTSVSPSTGVMISPGNTATWQTTVTAYAICGNSIGSTGMSEPYATLMISNIISKIDATVTTPVGTPVKLLSEWANIPINTYVEEYLTVPSEYKSLIISQTGAIATTNLSNVYYYFADQDGILVHSNSIDGREIIGLKTIVVPVISNTFYHSIYPMIAGMNVRIYGSLLEVNRVTTTRGMTEGPDPKWSTMTIIGDTLSFQIVPPYYGRMCEHVINMQFDAAVTFPTQVIFKATFNQNGANVTVPVYIATGNDIKISTDNKTVIIRFNMFGSFIMGSSMTASITGMTGVSGNYGYTTEIID